MNNTTQSDFRIATHKLSAIGIYVYTYSPKDGITRYRISENRDSDYHDCDPRFTCLGRKEFLVMAQGILIGYYHFKFQKEK